MISVVFLMRSPAYVRNFESVLRALAGRGIVTTVVFEERKQPGDEGGLALIEQLSGSSAALRYEMLPESRVGFRTRVRMALEAVQDYLRYFDAPFERTSRLRSRVIARVPAEVEGAIAATLGRMPRVRRALAGAARRTARRFGPEPHVRAEVARLRPAVLVVTPLVHFRSRQNDWVLAARELGIPSMCCVYGWDHFTTKGLIHAAPDRIAVWNDAQRDQAVDLHRIAGQRIRIAGAWPYEHWFGWTASRSREELVAELGLPADRALILYVCSSRFIAPREAPAVVRWICALRASNDPRVAGANVIVRPHPLNVEGWADRPLADIPGVTIFPPHGVDPVDKASRSDYFDSIALADAVVGVNTSALIESAIVDRPALAFPAPDFRSTQEQLPHFRQLVAERGAVVVAGSMAEHLDQLSQALANPAATAAARQRFVERFVRGDPGPATSSDRVVAVVEELLAGPAKRTISRERLGSTIGA